VVREHCESVNAYLGPLGCGMKGIPQYKEVQATDRCDSMLGMPREMGVQTNRVVWSSAAHQLLTRVG